MSDHWWRRKKRPWLNFFDKSKRVEEMMDDITRQTSKTSPRKTKFRRPYLNGFSMSIGPNGKPVIWEFSDVRSRNSVSEIREERKPLVDIIEESEDMIIVAELPGVEREEINLHTTESSLTISVDTPERQYRKKLILPVTVNTKSARISYKNRVLEVRFKKLSKLAANRETISLE